MSPRTSKQFQEIREEKMTLIMDVALKHFAAEGYHRTTISHIAKHAGISKGLMYNYYESKEHLLEAIVHRSVNEIYHHLDLDQDGILSEIEFEQFIRNINSLLKENREFWRLMMQMMIQNEVREMILKAFPATGSLTHPGHEPGDHLYPEKVVQLFSGYFSQKKDSLTGNSDPETEMEMFFSTLKGWAVKVIYSDIEDEEKNEKLINRIIDLYK